MILASGDRFDGVTVVLQGTWKVLSSISQNLKPAPMNVRLEKRKPL